MFYIQSDHRKPIAQQNNARNLLFRLIRRLFCSILQMYSASYIHISMSSNCAGMAVTKHVSLTSFVEFGFVIGFFFEST